ncbi:DUF3105 domain-containing protein [Brevibacillus fluminis]|uniref:DUF3105 domain-containing protein n=1 Tax=Brevibacillus fluminis TaxID=511487 RepID=A0A3M8DSQ7_9BACL|nr:DUF3105 domain-containing protein [Brevibacillus fluminis]RNB90485.1 DUF3105 domain-containing protein [Brevibacillus fluminis]
MLRLRVVSICIFSLPFCAAPAFAHGAAASEPRFQLSAWGYACLFLLMLAIGGFVGVKLAAKRRNKEIRDSFIGFAALSLIGTLITGIVWFNSDTPIASPDVSIDVQTLSDLGRDHVQPGEPIHYPSYPPTSGPHDPDDLKFGFYQQPQRFENLVHNLEHGDIVIYYKPDLAADKLEHLKVFTDLTKNASGVLLVPYADIKGEIVATAWTKMMVQDSFDSQKLQKFIAVYINKGPEMLDPMRAKEYKQ